MNDRQELPERTSNQPAAGWYPDPTSGEQRYWTGSEWGPPAPAKSDRDQDLTFGVLLGLAIPIVGGLYGVWMLLKGNGNGGWVILFSCFAAVLWVFVLAFLLGFSDGLSGR